MWGTPPVGPTTTTTASSCPSGNVPHAARMDTFLSDDSNEFNGQRRCHGNREQTTEFSSDEDDADDKTGRFLYPVLDLHKGGLHGQQTDSAKLWPSPPQAHSRSANPLVAGGLPSAAGLGGFPDRGLLHHHHHPHHHHRHHHHHHHHLEQQHDRMGVYGMRRVDSTAAAAVGPGATEALSPTVKGPGGVSSVSAAAAMLHHGQGVKMARTIKSYHCRMCEQEFENKSDMQRHAKDAHRMEEKGHKCSKCFKSFPSSQQLVQHSLVHTNVRKYPCRFCEKAFKQLSHVQQHQRIHTGERPYQCTVEGCSKAFRQLSSLQQHIKGHNIPLPKSYPITHCLPATVPDVCVAGIGGAFGHTDKINPSLARPHDLTCQVCEKHCVDEVRFFRHIHKYHPDYWRVFSGGRPLDDFIEMQEAKLQRGDEGEGQEGEGRAYTCDVCHKTCSSETGYWKHVTTQHPGMETEHLQQQQQQQGVHLYRCLVCRKLFTKKGYLLRHMEMKTDEQHCRALVELRKNSALFRVSQADTSYLGRSPRAAGQVDDDPDSPGDVDSKPHLADVDSGFQQVGGAGGESHDRLSSQQKSAPPRQAHNSSSSAYQPPVPPPPQINRSLSLDHHHGHQAFRERLLLDGAATTAARSDVTGSPPLAEATRLVVCDAPHSATDGATVSPNASLSSGSSSSPCSPMSVQSFSYHGRGGDGGGGGESGRPVTTAAAADGRPSHHRPLYSPGVHATYYPKSAGQETLLQGRGGGGGGGGYHGAHPFPQSPSASSSCLPRSPEDDDDEDERGRERSPPIVDDDQKPFVGAGHRDYLDHRGPFVHPSYAAPIRPLQDSLVRRAEAATDVACGAGMDLLQRQSSGADAYLRRCEAGEQGVDTYHHHHQQQQQQQQQGREMNEGYHGGHRSADALERDLGAYLRRGASDVGDSEVDAFLRRNSDISECYIASALSQLARSMPGFR